MIHVYDQKKDEYGGRILFDNGNAAKHTEYADRLREENNRKSDELCQKHFGDKSQYWSSRRPDLIEAFLIDFLGKQITLCRVIEYDRNNGYQIWRFDYNLK